jgi:hypothetical protein
VRSDFVARSDTVLTLLPIRIILASILRKFDLIPGTGKYVFQPKSVATISAKYGVVLKFQTVKA